MLQQWSQRQADQAAGFRQKYFNFADIPNEIATRILIFASADWPTYRSLILVSRRIRTLVYDTCLYHLPIMLHTQNDFCSFYTLISSHSAVGPCIRSLWLVAGTDTSVECTTGYAMLRKCPSIIHLACNVNLLRVLVYSSAPFIHHKLKDLTLIEPTTVPWAELLCQPAAGLLFGQLTHLRVSGGTELVVPKFEFTSLSHLSFECSRPRGPFVMFAGAGASESESAPLVFECTNFPVLQQIALSTAYLFRSRSMDPSQAAGRQVVTDNRMDVFVLPNIWKEAEVWEDTRRGGPDIWTRARVGDSKRLH